MSFSHLYIERAVANLPEVKTIESRLKMPSIIVDNASKVFKHVIASDEPVKKGKEVLLLTRNRGAFIKKCPGTGSYTCCGYKILNIGTFCTMDCSYCILQAYFHPPLLQYFVNSDDLLAELKVHFSEKTISRIGTGEFTDSLIWEHLTDFSRILVTKFSEQSRAVLELKTKTTAVNGLEHFNHKRKTIVSWSVNSQNIIKTEERNTPSLSSRIKAAVKCESWGYPLAFHFDPIIIYDGCEDDYRNAVEQIFKYVSPDNIAWISLGTFRFMPSLKSVIKRRFPDSGIVYGEFIKGLDGKMRYFKPLRIRLYRKMISWIKEAAPGVLVYFCMEDDEVWEKSLGFIPREKGGLPRMLDQSAVRQCFLENNLL